MLRQQLQQKLQQKLSPQQIQVIRLLELTTLELEERIKQEMVENPALDESASASESEQGPETGDFDAEEEGGRETAEEISMGDYLSEDDIPSYKLEASNYSKEKREEIPFSGSSSFHDYLISQLGLRELSLEECQIAEYIIGNIDDDGYLRRELEAISDDLVFQAGLDAPKETIARILKIIQDFDPPGVGATSLQEGLLLQLDRCAKRPEVRLAGTIVKEMFEEFSKKHYDKIQRQLNISEEELKAAIHEIVLLNPKPGYAWSDSAGDNANLVVPDFIVEIQDDEIYLSMNNVNVPSLKVSPVYAEMYNDYMGNKRNQTREKREALLFVKQKLDAAQGFIEAIKQRQQTLLNTMQVIIDLQREFFLTGDDSTLRPMILKDVAERSGYDISTISRASNSKYVQTSFGVYSLKYFFSESMQNDSGDEISTREVKNILQSCVDAEDKRKPLADDKLCDILKEKGYTIARRTVAKYREQLGIPVARLRKEI